MGLWPVGGGHSCACPLRATLACGGPVPVSRSWMSKLGVGRVGCTDVVTACNPARLGFQGQSWSSHKWMIRTVRSLETSWWSPAQ